MVGGELMPYEMILIEIRGRVGLVTLNRPQAMNALNNQLMNELMEALGNFDQNDNVGAMVITETKERSRQGRYQRDG
jgi:enoyl-CoA hydratase